MQPSRFLIVLTTVNLAILLITLVQLRPRVDEVAPVLRGRALQIIDDRGHVRASIAVLPAQAQPSGETYPETVLLRLITEQGRPSVKTLPRKKPRAPPSSVLRARQILI